MDIENKILELLKNICGLTEIKMDLDLFQEGFLDSLGVMELLVGIEEQTGVFIDPMEVEREDFNTAAKMISFATLKKES